MLYFIVCLGVWTRNVDPSEPSGNNRGGNCSRTSGQFNAHHLNRSLGAERPNRPHVIRSCCSHSHNFAMPQEAFGVWILDIWIRLLGGRDLWGGITIHILGSGTPSPGGGVPRDLKNGGRKKYQPKKGPSAPPKAAGGGAGRAHPFEGGVVPSWGGGSSGRTHQPGGVTDF